VYKHIVFSFFILVISRAAMAASPIINQVNDQRVIQGEQYSYLPELVVATNAHWTKTYGPDDVTVNPITGQVLWDIPANLPSESFHLGIKASNADGENEHTWIVTVGHGGVVYVGQNEDITTLKSAMSNINSGDTIVMRNGYWDHADKANTIPGNAGKLQSLPGGSELAFTTLMAEDPGLVVIDGKDEVTLLSIFGSTKHPDFDLNNNGWTGNTDYIAIKGLVLINSKTEALRVGYSQYIKLINIGVGPSAQASSGYSNLYIYRSQDVLVEGLYAWGHGRYKVIFQQSSNGVVRRSVARVDNYLGGKPIGGYISYCSKNIIFQNNILVDSDHPEYWNNHTEIINAFGVPATNCYGYPEFNEFKRNLALNVHMGLMKTDARTNVLPSLWEDIVGWDLKPARHHGGTSAVVPILSGVGATITNRMTLGEVNIDTDPERGGDYFLYSRSLDSIVKNSIFYRVGWDDSKVVNQGDLVRKTAAQFYFENNNLFDFKGAMNDPSGCCAIENANIDVDPQLKYLTMLPRDSVLRSAAEDGGQIGANLMTMLGKSGTFYGQAGFDSETNIPMWPFPGQDAAHQRFSDFSFTGTDRNGGTAGIQGNRGFAVENQTLTNYVWGYLGNVVPPMNVTATSGNFQVKLMWNTSAPLEQAKLASYKVYQLVDGVKKFEGEVAADTLSYYVTGLSNDVSVNLAVTAVDVDGHESDYAYLVSSIPAAQSKPLPPILSVE
jgi:hypothetical protein